MPTIKTSSWPRSLLGRWGRCAEIAAASLTIATTLGCGGDVGGNGSRARDGSTESDAWSTDAGPPESSTIDASLVDAVDESEVAAPAPDASDPWVEQDEGMGYVYWGGVWANARDDVWAVADSIAHWDGSSWSVLDVPNLPTMAYLHGVWGSQSVDVWAVGDGGMIFHWDGTAWSNVQSPTANTLRAVWGSGPSDVWAAGDSGTIVHWDGQAWTSSASGTTARLRGVWTAGANNAWATGDDGLRRWNGSAWSTSSTDLGDPDGGTRIALGAVWGLSSDDVWAMGEGTALHWNGTSWTTAATGTGADPSRYITGIWGAASNDIWAVQGPINFGGGMSARPFIGMVPRGLRWTTATPSMATWTFGSWRSRERAPWMCGPWGRGRFTVASEGQSFRRKGRFLRLVYSCTAPSTMRSWTDKHREWVVQYRGNAAHNEARAGLPLHARHPCITY